MSTAIAKDKENLAHVPIRKDIWKEVRSTFEATGSESRKLSPSSGIISTGGQKHFYMETQTTLADASMPGQLLLTSASQWLCNIREQLAYMLPSLKVADITVQNERTGGAYGGKAFLPSPIAMATAATAFKLKKQILCQLDRNADMTALGHRPPASAQFSTSVDLSSLKITELSLTATNDAGFDAKAGACQCTSLNAYTVPNATLKVRLNPPLFE